MYDISKENKSTKKEIEIRGRYLMMACDIEYCLLNIILFCNPDPHNHERVGQFTEMKMASKINNVIKDLREYKPDYYNEFKEDLNGLEEFRMVRNDMSHCKGDFPNEPDLNIFRIIYPERENKSDKTNLKEFMKYKEYTDAYINESVNRFAILNNHLSALWMRLSYEWNSKNHPFVNPSIGDVQPDI